MNSRNDSNYYEVELKELPKIDADEKDCQIFVTKVDGDVEHVDQLIDNGYAAHLLGAHAADHHVVQQGYQIGQSALQHNRDQNAQQGFVERSVTDLLKLRVLSIGNRLKLRAVVEALNVNDLYV